MDWIYTNATTVMLVSGLLLLIIEVAVLGFATFVLFFVGLSALITAGIFYTGLLEATYINAFISCAVFTAITALVLYKPLKQMQQQVEKKTVTGDFTGLRFRVSDAIAPDAPGMYKYSGIVWSVKCQEPIAPGTEVEVTNAEVGVFHVKVVTTNAGASK